MRDKMKKIILIFVTAFICFSFSANAQTGIELGKRYLKLGNTYREAGDFNQAIDYLDKGYRIVSSNNDYYWIGVANEFYGYYYRDMAKKNNNSEFLRRAQNYFDAAYYNYDRVVRQRDGSPSVISSLKNSIRDQITNDEFKATTIKPDKQKPTSETMPVDEECPEIKNYIVYVSLKEANTDPERVEILDLTGQEFTDFPKDILRYTNLKELILTNLGLSDLPEPIGNLQYLQRLNLDGNDLTRLPSSLKNLKCLKTIFIRGNFIDCDYLLSLQRNLRNLQIVTDREEENVTTIRGR